MANEPSPKRGDVWLTMFGPGIGGEIQKTRPAVIVSNDTANISINRVQVVPISSQVRRLYPGEAPITVNRLPRKAMTDQVTTASKLRLLRRLGELSREDLDAVVAALRIQLAL